MFCEVIRPRTEQTIQPLAQSMPLAPPAEDVRIGDRSSLLTDTVSVSGFAILAKLMGAAKTVAIAKVYGSSLELDSYLLAFLIASFLADVLCGALIPTLVPVFIQQSHSHGRQGFQEVYAQA